MQALTEAAKERGVAGFTADVLATNRDMLSIFYRAGLEVVGDREDGVYHLRARFPVASTALASV